VGTLLIFIMGSRFLVGNANSTRLQGVSFWGRH
jgi:hypothetical protein